MYVCILFIILHAPLLWSKTTYIGGFLHDYIISTKIPCSIYTFVKLTIIVYNLSKGTFVIFFFFLIFVKFVNESVSTHGQFSVRSTAAFRLSLSCSCSLQSYNMWSAVCSPLLQEHIGLSKILYLRRYNLILPCPVTIVVYMYVYVCMYVCM